MIGVGHLHYPPTAPGQLSLPGPELGAQSDEVNPSYRGDFRSASKRLYASGQVLSLPALTGYTQYLQYIQ